MIEIDSEVKKQLLQLKKSPAEVNATETVSSGSSLFVFRGQQGAVW